MPGGGWAAPDFRGHGGSFIPERIPSWRVFVDDVMAWQKAAHFDRPVALGHSLGGVTALMAEAFHPGTFRAIALFDPVIALETGGDGRANWEFDRGGAAASDTTPGGAASRKQTG